MTFSLAYFLISAIHEAHARSDGVILVGIPASARRLRGESSPETARKLSTGFNKPQHSKCLKGHLGGPLEFPVLVLPRL